MKKFIVKTATAKMPGSCRGRYGKVAVIELKPGFDGCRMISNRARGVARIVQLWDRQHAEGVNTAFRRAEAEAEALANHLNLQEALRGSLEAIEKDEEGSYCDL